MLYLLAASQKFIHKQFSFGIRLLKELQMSESLTSTFLCLRLQTVTIFMNKYPVT